MLQSPWRKGLLAGLAVVLAVSLGIVVRAAGGGGGGGGGDNVAVAVNTKDDSQKFKLAFKITRTQSDTVDSSNAAAAVSSCTNCRTIAIAIQAVIIMSDPSIVSPTNLALAVNENCSLCTTYADARQHVIGVGGVAHFTASGNQRIAGIRQELQQLRRLDLSVEELNARVDALSAELASVIRDELVLSSKKADAEASAAPTGSPATAGLPEASPASTAQTTPTPSASPMSSP